MSKTEAEQLDQILADDKQRMKMHDIYNDATKDVSKFHSATEFDKAREDALKQIADSDEFTKENKVAYFQGFLKGRENSELGQFADNLLQTHEAVKSDAPQEQQTQKPTVQESQQEATKEEKVTEATSLNNPPQKEAQEAQDSIATPNDNNPIAQQQKPGPNDNDLAQDSITGIESSAEDPFTKLVRDNVIRPRLDAIKEHLKDNGNKEVDGLDEVEFSKYLNTNKDKLAGLLKDEKLQGELSNIEKDGYKNIDATVAADSNKPLEQQQYKLRNVEWKANPDTSIRNAEFKVGGATHQLKETTQTVETDGKKITYRNIDFPQELPSSDKPVHMKMSLKCEDGKNMPKSEALYFTAHYGKDGKLEELSCHTPTGYIGEGNNAIPYVEKDGQKYTLPLTKGKLEAMQQEVAKNKGLGGVNLSTGSHLEATQPVPTQAVETQRGQQQGIGIEENLPPVPSELVPEKQLAQQQTNLENPTVPNELVTKQEKQQQMSDLKSPAVPEELQEKEQSIKRDTELSTQKDGNAVTQQEKQEFQKAADDTNQGNTTAVIQDNQNPPTKEQSPNTTAQGFNFTLQKSSSQNAEPNSNLGDAAVADNAANERSADTREERHSNHLQQQQAKQQQIQEQLSNIGAQFARDQEAEDAKAAADKQHEEKQQVENAEKQQEQLEQKGLGADQKQSSQIVSKEQIQQNITQDVQNGNEVGIDSGVAQLKTQQQEEQKQAQQEANSKADQQALQAGKSQQNPASSSKSQDPQVVTDKCIQNLTGPQKCNDCTQTTNKIPEVGGVGRAQTQQQQLPLDNR